jgi:hypothetical protein
MRAYGEGGSDRIHYIKDGDDGGTKNYSLWIVLIFIFWIILFSVFRNLEEYKNKINKFK